MTALPTRRDEEWRYAPAEVLAGLKALPEAEHIAVEAGATRPIYKCVSTGAANKVDIQRYQINIAEGARCEAFFLLTGGGYKRLDIDVTLAEGAHFELGAVGIGRGEEVTEIVTRLRHVAPGQSTSQLQETAILPAMTAPNDEARFAVAMAGFGQLLTGATYLGDWGWDQAIALAQGARGEDRFGYRAEAIGLMRLAQALGK